jgi:hypothetical protein
MHCELSKWSKALSLEITISCLLAKSQTCLIQVLNVLRTSLRAPYLEPSLVDTSMISEYVKLRVEPSPTLGLITQAAAGPPHGGPNLGPN